LRLSVFTGAPFCGVKRLSKEECGASDDALPHRTGGNITTRQSVEPSANLRCTQPRRRHIKSVMKAFIGAKHRGAIASMVERKTKLTILVLLDGPTSETTKEDEIRRLTTH